MLPFNSAGRTRRSSYGVAVSRDRFRLPAPVYAVLERDERVLLMRRAGSGYRDGRLSLPAGHLDQGEDV